MVGFEVGTRSPLGVTQSLIPFGLFDETALKEKEVPQGSIWVQFLVVDLGNAGMLLAQ